MDTSGLRAELIDLRAEFRRLAQSQVTIVSTVLVSAEHGLLGWLAGSTDQGEGFLRGEFVDSAECIPVERDGEFAGEQQSDSPADQAAHDVESAYVAQTYSLLAARAGKALANISPDPLVADGDTAMHDALRKSSTPEACWACWLCLLRQSKVLWNPELVDGIKFSGVDDAIEAAEVHNAARQSELAMQFLMDHLHQAAPAKVETRRKGGRPTNPTTMQRAEFWRVNSDLPREDFEAAYATAHPDDPSATKEDCRQAAKNHSANSAK